MNSIEKTMFSKVHFIIPVKHKGENLEFKSKVEECGYGLKFKLKVNGVDVVFQSDEEGKYKWSIKHTTVEAWKVIDKDLLEVIGRTIEEAVK